MATLMFIHLKAQVVQLPFVSLWRQLKVPRVMIAPFLKVHLVTILFSLMRAMIRRMVMKVMTVSMVMQAQIRCMVMTAMIASMAKLMRIVFMVMQAMMLSMRIAIALTISMMVARIRMVIRSLLKILSAAGLSLT